MFIRLALLFTLGVCGGALVAAGVYAFITILGLVPRLAARTHTAAQIWRYEDWIILGAVFGNGFYLFSEPVSQWLAELWPTGLAAGGWTATGLWAIGQLFMTLWGFCSGVFVGCLVMSLAETLDTLPTINRRIRLAVGIQYILAAIGLGKAVGSLVYFWYNIAA